jgi:hypothetical protein
MSPLRLRGDELDLYAGHYAELARKIARDVNATREDVEDACAFTWQEVFRVHPDRDGNRHGRLYRTAQREAWRLTALSWRQRELVNEDGVQIETADPAIGTQSASSSRRRCRSAARSRSACSRSY